MKDLEIERVSVHVVGPETERHAWASDMHTQYMTNTIVRLKTRGGLEGVAGVSSFTEFGFDRAVAETIRPLLPHLIGASPHSREALWQKLLNRSIPVAPQAHSAIDIALWDLAGKQLQAPIWKLLGGWRKRLPTYASTYHGDRNGGLSSAQDYVDFAEQCYEMGYRAFKMHGWCDGNAQQESAAVLALGNQFRGRMTLMLDPACELRTFADTLAVGRACDEAGFFWYEDPMRDGGWSQFAHRKLRQFIKTPLLQTEHVRGLEPKADFIVNDGTDFVRADPEYDLGITGTMKIAHLAEAFGLDVELHAPGPAHRHCMAAIRNTNFYELALVGPKCRNAMPPVYADAYSDQLDGVGKDSCFPVPDGPGLGVTYDWDFIKRHRTQLHEFK